jgi:hypothetical protein
VKFGLTAGKLPWQQYAPNWPYKTQICDLYGQFGPHHRNLLRIRWRLSSPGRDCMQIELHAVRGFTQLYFHPLRRRTRRETPRCHDSARPQCPTAPSPVSRWMQFFRQTADILLPPLASTWKKLFATYGQLTDSRELRSIAEHRAHIPHTESFRPTHRGRSTKSKSS